MQYDLYILVYFDDGDPKFFCLAPPLRTHSKFHDNMQGLISKQIKVIENTRKWCINLNIFLSQTTNMF